MRCGCQSVVLSGTTATKYPILSRERLVQRLAASQGCQTRLPLRSRLIIPGLPLWIVEARNKSNSSVIRLLWQIRRRQHFGTLGGYATDPTVSFSKFMFNNPNGISFALGRAHPACRCRSSRSSRLGQALILDRPGLEILGIFAACISARSQILRRLLSRWLGLGQITTRTCARVTRLGFSRGWWNMLSIIRSLWCRAGRLRTIGRMGSQARPIMLSTASKARRLYQGEPIRFCDRWSEPLQ